MAVKTKHAVAAASGSLVIIAAIAAFTFTNRHPAEITEVNSATAAVIQPIKDIASPLVTAVNDIQKPVVADIQQPPKSEIKIITPPAKTQPDSIATPSKLTLQQIVASARTWSPAYESWQGKSAPDFSLTDITGTQHKLSDYKGKNVLVIFWATWCGPCKHEMPNLIALRNIVGPDKLAMLAISHENPETIKRFAASSKINYTLLTDSGDMPAPYNTVNAVPSSFFITPDGKIKLAAAGTLSYGELKAILNAD